MKGLENRLGKLEEKAGVNIDPVEKITVSFVNMDHSVASTLTSTRDAVTGKWVEIWT